MKNCLIVLGVLLGCFIVALFLVFKVNLHSGRPVRMANRQIAQWKDYDPGPLKGIEVSIFPNQMLLDLPASPQFRRITENGRWSAHAFYIDSHLDAPAEVAVAHEEKNEDLEVDLDQFLPNHPGKVTLVIMSRGGMENSRYPVNFPGVKVTYPPPKGLITPGMLEWDLQMLPWQADHIEAAPVVVHVYLNTLSDGKVNQPYYPPDDGGQEDTSMVYTYHSDRPDATPLLVTVDRGKVVKVTGGAEDTDDPPYQFPATLPDDESAPPPESSRTWGEWFFDLIFKK